MRPWVISDTHFNHEKIIQYCRRPYRNAGQMDEDIIRRWNNRVGPEDMIYHLGDVGMTRHVENVSRIIPRLNGKKILILGNHDKTASRMMEFGFDFACEEMVITHYGKRLWLIHKPQRTKPDSIDYVLHGHIHNSTREERARLHPGKGELLDIPSFNINLSVEVVNYEPQSLKAVVQQKIIKDCIHHDSI